MAIVPTTRIAAGIWYAHNPLHRNRTRGKSQWTIDELAELESFRRSLNRAWLMSNVGWGLHFENNKVTYLGIAEDNIRRVFVAKFINDEPNSTWHGYPADHQRNQQDIPARIILKDWLDRSILSPPKIRKLARGQPCSL
jgi:hypothetical protein